MSEYFIKLEDISRQLALNYLQISEKYNQLEHLELSRDQLAQIGLG